MPPRSAARKSPALAKLTRPRLYAAYPRERLFAKLDELRRCAVIWIAGPPGAGKTTLTATWLDARKLRGLWYQVDVGDADPATFFYYLRAAAVPVAAKRRASLPLLTPEYLSDIPNFSRLWFRDLFSRLPRPVTLVLDNYQEVAEDSALHRAIEAATHEIPEDAHLIVLSRSMPPAAYARLQTSERFAAIEWDQLRLTLEEARGMAAGKDALAEEAIGELHQQCDGWAAGFTLMRERTRRTGLVNRVGDAQTMETVFNYFASQVFDDASAEHRDILVRTAFLPRVTVAQAEAISGNPAAGKLLEGLYRRHLFTNGRTGKEQVAYEYHALFRAFLKTRAAQFYTPEGQAQLTTRAASLLEKDGQLDEAVTLYLEAQDWKTATELILKLAPDFIAQGRGQTVNKWAIAMPRAAIDAAPWLSYWRGAALTAVNLREARAACERAYAGFVHQADRLGQIMAVVGVLESYLLELDNLHDADPWLPIVDRLFADDPSFPSPEAAARVYGTLLSFMSWVVPRHRLLPICRVRLAALLRTGLNPNVKVMAASQLLEYYGMAGHAREGSELIVAVESLLTQPDVTPLVRALWRIRTFRHYSNTAEYARSFRNLDEARSIATENGFHFLFTLIHGHRCDMAFDLWDLDLARAEIEKKRAALPLERKQGLRRYYTLLAKEAAATGDWDTALRHAEEAVTFAFDTGLTWTQMVYPCLLASILVERGEFERARAALAVARDAYPEEHFPLAQRRCGQVAAALAARAGEMASARELLRGELAALRALGCRAPFYNAITTRRLCHLALSEGIEVEYVRDIIRLQNIRPVAPDIPHWPWPVKVYTLGTFRLEIDGSPLPSGRKAQHKPLDLLKALIAFGGRNVSVETLANALWPDAEADAAQSAMAVTLMRLRKLLKDDEAILLRDGKLSLDERRVWVDVWSLKRQLDALEATLRDAAKADAELGKLGQQVLALYPGHFLAAEADQPWMLPLRERLRARVLRVWLALGRRLQDAGRWDEAQSLYQRGVELDNLAEEFYRRLMICHRERGEQAEALTAYRRCRDMLSIVLGVKPSAETEAVRKSVMQ
jgi:ATP/maltotriose-dependent transcriptional regulator MalT